MRFNVSFPAGLFLAVVLAMSALSSLASPANGLKFEAVLVWAANVEKSPDPNHKPVEQNVLKKLRELPLKWKHFFAVNKVEFSIDHGGTKEVSLSEQCKIGVRDIDGKNVEVSLIGKGEPVLKRMQPLPKDELLVLGGDAPDETGWLVVLKRLE